MVPPFGESIVIEAQQNNRVFSGEILRSKAMRAKIQTRHLVRCPTRMHRFLFSANNFIGPAVFKSGKLVAGRGSVRVPEDGR
jgi:hypothetical protein